jgi:hypothetical protein
LKDLRSVMTRYKTIDELKKAMLCVLETGVLPVIKEKKEEEKEEPVKSKEKTPKTEKKEKKGSSTTYEQSTENKAIKSGVTVVFTASNRHPVYPGQELTGTVDHIKFENRSNAEYCRIKIKDGSVFHKTVNSIKIKK